MFEVHRERADGLSCNLEVADALRRRRSRRADGLAAHADSLSELQALDAKAAQLGRLSSAARVAIAEGLEVLARSGGHHELGFSSINAFALERCERSASWVRESRVLVRRLEGLPVIRAALAMGRLSFSMAQVLAGVATKDDETEWLVRAHGSSVRVMRRCARDNRRMANLHACSERRASLSGVSQMSAVGAASLDDAAPKWHARLDASFACATLSEKAVANPICASFPGATITGQTSAAPRELDDLSAVTDASRVALRVTVDTEDAWLFECARIRGLEAGAVTMDETIEAMLGEGSTSLFASMEKDLLVPFEGTDTLSEAQAARQAMLAKRREEAEARSEAAIVTRDEPTASAITPRWERTDTPAIEIDRRLREFSSELAGRDLLLGEVMEAFWRRDGWRRLGYANAAQYARERLGMSLSSVKGKRVLAQRARVMNPLRDAVMRGDLGYEGARLVAAVSTTVTAEEWIDRARSRTVKHLREEVDAAHMLARMGVALDRRPPSEASMAEIATFERCVLEGKLSEGMRLPIFRSRATHGRARMTLIVDRGTRRYYRWMERTYRQHGPRDMSFLRFLCNALLKAWPPPQKDTKYGTVYARDRYRCANPVCSRRDLTPHHLQYRSAGGDDSEENLTTLCVWCHLDGVHGGRIAVTAPASAMTWRLGRPAHTVVNGRRRVRLAGRAGADASANRR
ncbi:MAG TPA: HNH endonuclease [Polyangiaceae bacterium]|jgi:hypothetical protein|nr:HNH endonuclease [Polyangiaceae bacterium]